MRLEYSSSTKINVFIETHEIIESNKIKNIDFNLTLKRIVSEALNRVKDDSIKAIFIEVNGIDIEGDKVSYSIKGKAGTEVHEIALTLGSKDKQRVIDEIAKKHIVQKERSEGEVGLESILERFSADAKPIGLIGKLKSIFGEFFNRLRENFRLIDLLWEGMSRQSPKHRAWDLALLSEICGSPAVEKLSMHQALAYLSKLLERERTELVDPLIHERIKKGADIASKVESLRGQFKSQNFRKLVKNLQTSIVGLAENQKLLFPVGFKERDQLVEMLLEIDRGADGKFTVTLISASEEVRDLFDREVGIELGGQSLRREISNVSEADLLAVIPTLIELQTSPPCLSTQNSSEWRNIFYQSLHFNDSIVKVGKITERYKKERAAGHLSETMNYIGESYRDVDQSKKFDLSARLRLFLDICKNKKGLQEKEFWTLARTTALQLANLIEENKRLVGSSDTQGKELTHIYTELKGFLDQLDISLSEVSELRKQKVPLLSGHLENDFEASDSNRLLLPFTKEPDRYPAIDPPFTSWDPTDSSQSIKNWSERCKKLIELNQIGIAGQEAKLMVRMLPKPDDPFWGHLKGTEAQIILKEIEVIGESIARASYEKKQPTLQDIASITALNYYAFKLASQISDSNIFSPLLIPAQKAMNDLKEARLTENDYLWLKNFELFDPGFIERVQSADLKNYLSNLSLSGKTIPDHFHSLIKMSQLTAMTLRVEGNDYSLPLPKKALEFEVAPEINLSFTMKGSPQWQTSLQSTYKTPLNLLAPDYATDVSQEITNRYLTEFCPLGCIRDNCPNYNEVNKHEHRMHPLYMLHNYIETYSEKLISRGTLHRDEVTDLMYTQQTNQNANTLWVHAHDKQHGFSIANGFNSHDMIIQAINTSILFLEHPHFLKYPDLRWQFETKILNNRAFAKLLSSDQYSDYKPFLTSLLKKLKKEMLISSSGGDEDSAAYLLFIIEELKEMISHSDIDTREKESLLAILKVDSDRLLMNFSQQLIGKSDEESREKQKLVFSLLLNQYYRKFCNDPNDPCFSNDKDLEMILYSIECLEGFEKGQAEIDPELRDKSLTLRSWLVPHIKAKIAQDKTPGHFVNKILFYFNPMLAVRQLNWDSSDFPSMKAIDSKGELYQFDLFTGKGTFGKSIREKLPENIKKNEVLQDLYGHVLEDSWNVFSSSNEQGKTSYIVYTSEKFPDHRILIEKGKSSHERVKILNERMIETPKGKEWVSYIRFNEQDRCLSGQNISTHSDIPPALASLIGHRHCWMDQSQEHLYIIESGKKEPYAIIKLKTVEKQNKIREIVIKDVDIQEEGVHLLAPDVKLLENFSSIEDPQFILTKGKNHSPASLHYVRYELATTGAPLSYELGEYGISSRAFPGYRLEKYGIRPGKKDAAYGVLPLPLIFDGFQLLKKDGDEKVLIPLRQFEQQLSHAGDPLALLKPIYPQNYAKCPLFEFSVDPETNRLVAKSGDAYAYLAYLCFAHHDYDSASYYLRKASSSVGYDLNYDIILGWMNDIKDVTPNGIAMKLRFELFHEKILEDRRLRKIRVGKQGEAEEVDIQRIPRLIRLSDIYEKYVNLIQTKQTAENGPDPSLALSFNEEQEIVDLIKELLKEHGNQYIHPDESQFIRAKEVPIQKYLSKDEQDPLGINRGVNLIWLYHANLQERSLSTIKDPLWIVQNFRDLFNQILENDSNSIAFKQFEHQIRMVSELPKNGLSQPEILAIQSAQYYLLKLITVKRLPSSSLDPTFFDRLKRALGGIGKLPRIQGSSSKDSRIEQLARLQKLTNENCFGELSFYDPDRALARCVLLESFHEKDLEKPTRKFIVQWLMKGKPKEEFHDDFRNYLMSEIYGSSAAKSLQTLDQVFKLLDPISIDQAIQKMQIAPSYSPKQSETYQSKYGKLIESVDSHPVPLSRIEILEKEIQSTPEFQLPQKTIIPKGTFILAEPILKEKEEFFKVSDFEAQKISDKIFDDLALSQEKAFVRQSEENRKDMHAYIQERGNVTIEKKNAEKLYATLKDEAQKIEQEKEILKRDLLQFVERFETPAGVIAMRRLTGKGVKPSLDFIIGLWRRGEIDKSWDQHLFKKIGMRKIPEELLKQLDQEITHYLELSTRGHLLNRVLDQTESFLHSCGKDDAAIGDPQLAGGLHDLLRTERHFTLNSLESSDFRDLLFLEYNQQIILRKTQVETISELLSNPNSVRQLRMGGGKSKVLLPLLAQRKATGKNLVMLMLPEELYETNCRDLDDVNRKLFGQEMYRFEFSRQTDISEKAIQKIYLRMLKTIKDKGFMMTTRRSMLSFENAYLDLFHKLENERSQSECESIIGQMRGMSKILKLFHEVTSVHADEVDACLDIRKEVNFSLGNSQKIDQVKADVGAELAQIMFSAKIGEPLYEMVEALKKNTQAAISPSRRKQLLEYLTGAYYDKHPVQLNVVSKKAFVDYIMNQEGLLAKETEDWVFKLKESNNDLFKNLTTVKAFMDRGFGTTLSRIGNVNYGRDPVSGQWTIPYKASNTPHIGSVFDEEIEQISYTIQDYIQNGVNEQQVCQIIAQMRNRAMVEMRRSQSEESIGINDTESGMEFRDFIKEVDPERKLGEHVSFATLSTPKSIEALVSMINSTPEGRLAFCHQYVLRQIRLFPEQINSLSVDLTAMVRHFGGFTGTPWNLHTYDDKIDAKKTLGVDGATWALMLGEGGKVEINSFAFDALKPIDSILVNLDVVGNYQAVIDAGAYLRGTGNHEFIERSLEIAQQKGITIGGGIYFDAIGQIVKKERLDESSLPLNVAQPTDEMTNLTLYDQAHTIGADIKQGRKARAIVTIGENTFIRDLFQAVWRLREIQLEQSVVLAVSDTIKERILEGEKRELTIEDILKFCLFNEATREAEDNFRAEKQKIQGFTKRLVLSQIVKFIADDGGNKEILALAHHFDSMFIKSRSQELVYDQYGKLKAEESPSKLLQKFIAEEIEKCKESETIFEKITQKALDPAIEKTVKEHLIERPHCQEDFFLEKMEIGESGEGAKEVEAEVEQELELVLQTETEQETQVVTETVIPMLQLGTGAHGDVRPLSEESIRKIVESDLYPDHFDLLREIKTSLDFFDSGIYCSAVFERNLSGAEGKKIPPQSAFYSNRKPVKNIVIAKCDGRWTMIIPTIHEAHESCRQFIKNANWETHAVEVAISEAKPMIVYKSGEDRSDALPFTDKEDEDQFYRLYIQAKLYNGEIEYGSDEEQKVLKNWLISKGPEQFKAYFEQNILAAKPSRFAMAYPKSSLYNVFKELCPDLN